MDEEEVQGKIAEVDGYVDRIANEQSELIDRLKYVEDDLMLLTRRVDKSEKVVDGIERILGGLEKIWRTLRP